MTHLSNQPMPVQLAIAGKLPASSHSPFNAGAIHAQYIAEMAQAQNEADAPDTVWVSYAEVKARIAEARASLLAQMAGERR